MADFATLQTRLNAAVMARLSDSATLNGVAVRGFFDTAAQQGLDNMMLGSNPTFTCLESAAGSDPRGKLLELDGEGYAVRRAAPDGSGMTVLVLEQLNDVSYAAAALKLRPGFL
jgi:hypothetical protein